MMQALAVVVDQIVQDLIVLARIIVGGNPVRAVS